MQSDPRNPPNVALFVTCLIDAWRPVVGFAAIKLLEDAGCRVSIPSRQTCCGQPAMNSGDTRDAKKVARDVIDTFAEFDYVVAPSGSCAGTITLHYREMFKDEPEWLDRARQLAARTFELTSFLVDVLGVAPPAASLAGRVTYHDSCSSLREMGVSSQPRKLLSGAGGVTLTELKEPEACCGFGGLFCVKYPEISEKMVQAKVDDIVGSGAGTVLGGDLGCLLNIAGRLSRQGHAVHVRHVAEVLAGMTEDAPPIGEARQAR